MYSVIGSDGQTYGPVDVNTLKNWCAEGRVTPATNIIDGVSGRTMRASDLQDLYGIFPTQDAGHDPVLAPQPKPVDRPAPSAQNLLGPQSPMAPGGYSNPPGTPGSAYSTTPSYSGMRGVTPVVMGQKSKLVAALLAFFLGGFGIHRFYLGYTGIGIAILLLGCIGVGWIWALIDFILILVGSLPDAQGYDLV